MSAGARPDMQLFRCSIVSPMSMQSPFVLHRTFCAFALVLLTAMPSMVVAADKKAPPAKPAAQYIAFDTHEKEHVTIAADPCDDPKNCDFFRLPYIQHGFLPVRVVVTNDGDKALSLDDVRMQFISENKDVIPAATLEDINRRLFSRRSAQGTKIPGLPYPVTIHHAPVDKKVTQDDNDFGFPGTTVNAHASLSGYLFYDIRELDDPAMRGAEIYVKEIKTLDGKQQLFAFTIPLDKWLAAQPKKEKKPVLTPADDKSATAPGDSSTTAPGDKK